MRSRGIRLSIAVAAAAALAGMTAFGPFAQASQPASATGHGWYLADPQDPTAGKRQFSFNAVTHQDGTVSGHAVVHNPAYDFFATIDISCLRVDGNMAHLGGTVTKTNDPFFGPGEGTYQFAFFTVVDTGEPGSDEVTPDTISGVNFAKDYSPETCQDIGPTDFTQQPIMGGNVQVRQGASTEES